MGSSRKSYAQLEKEIQALIKQQDAVLDASANLFMRSLMTSEIKRTLSKEDSDVVKKTAKKIAESLPDFIEKAKKQVDEKEAPRQNPAKGMLKADENKSKSDAPSVALKTAYEAPSIGATSAVKESAAQHRY